MLHEPNFVYAHSTDVFEFFLSQKSASVVVFFCLTLKCENHENKYSYYRFNIWFP